MRQTAALGVVGLSLLFSAGCSTGTGPGPGAGGSSGVAALPAASATATPTAATPAALTTLEAALRRAAGGGRPSTGQLRDAVTAAGFSADVQVAASRTPTGLDADAVEVGVKEGEDCLVGQVRNGTVHVAVLPVLADGRCLVGAAAPGM